MRNDITDLKKLTLELLKQDKGQVQESDQHLIQRIYGGKSEAVDYPANASDILQLENSHSHPVHPSQPVHPTYHPTLVESDDDDDNYLIAETVEDEPLNLEEQEVELIRKSLERNKGKRKAAAEELGISERTLYRKIKQYNL